MLAEFNYMPDPVNIAYARLLKLFPADWHDAIHLQTLPDGYNAMNDGLAFVVMSDEIQVDETAHTRELVKINIYGASFQQVATYGRRIYMAFTQSLAGYGLGIDNRASRFFGAAPSNRPTGFVSTMSLSTGIDKTHYIL